MARSFWNPGGGAEGTPSPPPPPATPEAAPEGRDSASGLDTTFVLDVDGGVLGTASDLDDTADAVHDVLKRTDVWFAYHATALEREAVELAEKHAEKGQPRHDLERDGPLEIEVLIEQKGKEVLWGWADRVKRKMQGAVEAETEKIGSGLAAARQAVANAEAARDAMERQSAALADQSEAAHTASRDPHARDATPHPEEVVESERHLEGRWFWPLMVALVLADFFANVPVFTELFPANPLVDRALQQWEETVLTSGDIPSWFGVARLFKHITVHPEPSVLALVVVLVFMSLGHILGGHLRSLVLLWRHRNDASKHSIGGHFRQSSWPAVLAGIGICLTVGVLYQARGHVKGKAEERLHAAEARQADIQKEMATIQASGAMVSTDLFSKDGEATADVGARREKREYASAIHDINVPIMLLNCVLVIVAVVAGYLRERRTFSVTPRSAVDRSEQHRAHAEALRAGVEQMQARLGVTRDDFSTRRFAAHEALRSVGSAVLRVEHLFQAELLRDWYGKAERLRRAIPLFRTENARLRSLDVEDILAFRNPVRMELPTTADLKIHLERPPALAAYHQEYESLRERLHRLDLLVPGEVIPFIAIRPSAAEPARGAASPTH